MKTGNGFLAQIEPPELIAEQIIVLAEILLPIACYTVSELYLEFVSKCGPVW